MPTDRVNLPLPVVAGLLSAQVGQDFDFGTSGDIARTLRRAVIQLQEPSSSGSVVVEIRAGGVLVATVTVPAGLRTGSSASLSAAIAASTALSLRVTSTGASAQRLSGYLEMEGTLP